MMELPCRSAKLHLISPCSSSKDKEATKVRCHRQHARAHQGGGLARARHAGAQDAAAHCCTGTAVAQTKVRLIRLSAKHQAENIR